MKPAAIAISVLLAQLVLLFAFVDMSAAESKSKVRKITIEAPLPRAKLSFAFGPPVEITSGDAIGKTIPNSEAIDELKRKIDFDNEKLLVFLWSGSGEDRILAKEHEGKVVLTLVPGKTRDLRPHCELFAVARDVTYTVKVNDAR